MRKILTIISVYLVVAPAGVAAVKPNIVLFMADDMGMGDTSAYQDLTGNADGDQIATPAMDRLANMGVRFTDAHTPSSRCTPTRYGLLTGRNPWRSRLKHFVLFGSQGDPLIERDRPTLATMLRGEGYGTAMVGKWHVGLRYRRSDGSPADGWDDADFTQPLFDCPLDHGFEYARYTSRSHGTSGPTGNPPGTTGGPGHLHGRRIIAATGRREFATDGPNAYVLDKLGSRHSDNAIEYLETHLAGGANAAKPFFLYYSANSNHTPYTPDREIGGEPVRGAGRMKSDEPATRRLDHVYENDVALNRLIRWLETQDDPRHRGKKLIETTVVIFTSDNGADKNNKAFTGPFRSNKASCYEGGHRVPFIVAWGAGGIGDGDPATAGQTNTTLISLVDLYATFAGLLDVALPDPARGRKGAEDSVNILPAWRGQNLKRATPMFYSDHKEAGAYGLPKDPAAMALRMDDPVVNGRIQPGRWKIFFDADLLRKGEARPRELYELKSDPREQRDLIHDPSRAPLIVHLARQAWLHRSYGGHRLAELGAGPPAIFDLNDRHNTPALLRRFGDQSAGQITIRRGGLNLNYRAVKGKKPLSAHEFLSGPNGLGIQGGGSGQVDDGEAVLISFDQDVLIESVALVAGEGRCGGFYQIEGAAPLAIYCVDADNDSKDQQGIIGDIGVLKAGQELRLDSAPHHGADPAGDWTLRSMRVRALK